MKIGIIGGTGPQGLGIAKRLAIAGEDVIVGSRKEEKALTVVEEANEEIKEYNPKELVGMANEDAAAATMVWAYVGELAFNMLMLVGAIKMSDRVVKEMMGL